MDDEITFHLEARTKQLLARGIEPDEARAQALEEFGPLDEAREEMLRSARRHRRHRRRSSLAADLVSDIRFGFRSARSHPGPFTVALLSIAVGMAAVSTMWTALDRLILRPLPFDPDGTVVYVGTSERGRDGGASNPTAPGDFLDLRQAARTVDLAAYRESAANLGGEAAEWVSVRHITPDFLDVLDVSPALGRGFQAADAVSDQPEVALLSHGVWERHFGADPEAVGSTIALDGRSLTIVGVLPPKFELGRGHADVWVPLRVQDDGIRASRTVIVVGRMNGDLATTRSELTELTERLAERFPETHATRAFRANTIVAELSSGPVVKQGLGASLAAASFVLLIACANVANLLLAWGSERTHEIALRRALGAGRTRILRQLLAEAMLLAGVGGAFGIGLSALGVRGLASITPEQVARVEELALDARNVAVGMAIALASTLLFGVAPAFRTLAAGERRRLVAGVRTGVGRGGHRLRSALVAFEVGLAVVLVTTTALVVRSYDGVRGVQTGFESDGTWSLRVTLPERAYPDATAQLAGIERLRAAVAAVPGVSAVGVGVGLPGGGWRWMTYGHAGDDPGVEARPRVLARIADPAYLDVIGLQPVRGRSLTVADDRDGTPVALVNQSFAAELWPDEDPIGLTLDVGNRSVEIVGVMPDAREVGARVEPWSALYIPLAQWPSPALSVVLRSRTPEPPVPAIRSAVATLQGGMAIREVRTLESVLLQSAGQLSALSVLLGVMAAAALLLALVGVYAATSYGVVCRVPEIGVRMALGADAPSVRARILRRAMLVSVIGLTAGLPAAWAMGRGLSNFVDESAGSAPGTFVGVGLLLLAVSAAAAWIPARRASSVHPANALRAE